MQKKAKQMIKVTVFIFSFLFAIKCALADDTMKSDKVMKVRLKPTFSYSGGFTKNVELQSESEDAKERWVNHMKAGMILQVPRDRLYFETAYNFGYYDANGHKPQTSHSGKGLMRYALSETASIGIEDNYTTDVVDFIGSKRYELNTATADLKKQFGPRLSSGLKYTFETFNATNDRSIDYRDNGGDLGFEYRLTPMTTLSTDMNFHKRAFRHDEETGRGKDYKAWDSSLKVSQRLFKRLGVSVSAGYAQRDYDEGDDEDLVTYGAGLTSNLTNFSDLTINYEHSLRDSFYALDDKTLQSGSPFLTNEKIASLLDSQYRQIETDRIVANLNYRLTDKDIFDVGFSYMWSKTGSSQSTQASNTVDLDEQAYTIGAGYTRKVTSWLGLGVLGSYGSRKSNTRGDYDYRSVGGAVNVAFSY